MTEKKRKGARVKFFPPYALMFGLLISSLIEVFIYPMPFMGNGSYLFLILGITITLASFVLAIFTLTIFTANDQNPHPKALQNELFVGGSFRFSRNPIYLAIIIFIAQKENLKLPLIIKIKFYVQSTERVILKV